jgi:hypothetical protein
MKLIGRRWNAFLDRYEDTWLADDESAITSDFCPDCACGSIIMVISTESTWMKNTKGQWQKCGSTEVIG